MKKLLLPFAILIVVTFISCSDSGTGPDPGNSGEYNVSVTVTPSGAGSISPSSDAAYEEGKEIELQAKANEGYLFTGWSGDVESTDNPLALTVDKDYTLTANFEKKSYPLTVNTRGEGLVSEEIVEQKSKEYGHGTVVQLTANPAKGYKFVEWTGDMTGTANPAQITVDGPMEVTAVFKKKSFALNVTATGEGSVTKSPDQAEYLYNTTVDLEANPASGWNFVEWQGDISSTDTVVTVTVDTTMEIKAVFENNFAGGAGTTADPYKISTLEQLQKIGELEFRGAHYIQINNIDATATAGWNNGKGFVPITFTGSYDGQQYIISNLTINRTHRNIGLFGYAEGAEIRNVKLENVDITGDNSTGGLVGTNISGRIYDSYVTGKVHCTSSRCGGLVGDNYGNIENSFADVEVTSIDYHVGGLAGINWGTIRYSHARGNVTGIRSVGGLVGMNIKGSSGNSQISKSYAQGQVTGKEDIGGLIGENRADTYVSYSYATGKVSISTSGSATGVGGLIGSFDSGSTVSNCYWDTESTGQAEGIPGGGGYNLAGLTTAQMTGSAAKTNMSEFDFVSIWKTVDGGYPALFWE